MSKIAIYSRKSKYIENSISIETQLELCKKYFSAENEFEIFEDEGYSGKNTSRPAFERMMALCKMGKFDTVAIYKIDRIARNVVDFFKIFDTFQKENITLVSISEGFDPRTPQGRLMMTMLAGMADMERMNIAQRVKDSMIHLAKMGCFTGGNIPKGCIVEKKNGKSYLKINDVELIKTLFNSYIQNGSLFLAYKNINSLGIKISREGYRKVLRNPLYVKSSKEIDAYLQAKGYEVIGDYNNKNGYMTYGKKNNEKIAIISKCIAPLDTVTWLKVNMSMDKRKNEFKNTSEVNWITSVLKCPYCGGYYHLANANHTRYYACQNRIARTALGVDKNKIKCENKKYTRCEVIENKVSEYISVLENKKIFNSLFKNNYSIDNSNILRLEKAISKNNNAIDNLIEKLILLSNDAAKPITYKIEKLTEENKKLKEQLEIEKLIQIQNETNRNSLNFIYNKIVEFKNLTCAKEKRDYIKIIFKEILYDPFNDEFTYVP